MNDHQPHLYSYATQPAYDWTHSFFTSALGLLLLILFYNTIIPLFTSPSPPWPFKHNHFLTAPIQMATRLTNSLITFPKRAAPIPQHLGGSISSSSSPTAQTNPPETRAASIGSALPKVLGLPHSTLLHSAPLPLSTLLKPSRLRPSFSTSSRSHAPPGLGNWDNSCYQNSVMQGLSSLPSLPPFLRSVLAATPRVVEGQSTSEALLGVLNRLSVEVGGCFWLPRKLKSMSTWIQQDAQEYFSKVLDQVDKEALAAAGGKRFGVAELGLAGVLEEEEAASDEKMAVLKNPLEGMLAQRVACTRCAYSEGLSLIPFNCVTVPLSEAYVYDVRDCLDEYTKLEFIEGVECPKCTLLRSRLQLKKILADPDITDKLGCEVNERLSAVEKALEQDDFSDNTVVKKCRIAKKHWMSSTKSRQAVVARAPQSLVIHVNRSCFDELTGAMTKNYTTVQFPKELDLGLWCIGKWATLSDQAGSEEEKEDTDAVEEGWEMNPLQSMLPYDHPNSEGKQLYRLRAVVTHHGLHENGHYVCYRVHEAKSSPAIQESEQNVVDDEELSAQSGEGWWRISDEDVVSVSEETVLRQGEVFMLFYERMDITEPPQREVSIEDTESSISAKAASTVEISVEEEQKSSDDVIMDGVADETSAPKQESNDNNIEFVTTPPLDSSTSSTPESPSTPEQPLVAMIEDDMDIVITGSETNGDTQTELLMKVVSTQQQQQPLVMRTAGVTERHDNTETMRMVAAT